MTWLDAFTSIQCATLIVEQDRIAGQSSQQKTMAVCNSPDNVVVDGNVLTKDETAQQLKELLHGAC